MRTYKIATIGGDGIGPEVVEAGVQVLKVCAERDGGFTLDVQDFKWGSDYYRKHGFMMPTDGADQLRKFDAILFGAVGAPDIPDHITLWGLRLAIRWLSQAISGHGAYIPELNGLIFVNNSLISGRETPARGRCRPARRLFRRSSRSQRSIKGVMAGIPYSICAFEP